MVSISCPFGELENHLPSYSGNPYIVTDQAKANVFQQERDLLLRPDMTEAQILQRYGCLLAI